VQSLDLEDHVALLERAEPDWSTTARDITDFQLLGIIHTATYGPLTATFGSVKITNQVVSYLKRRLKSGEVMGEVKLDLPPRDLRTQGVWWTLDPTYALGLVEDGDLPGALHAAEHAAIGLLPLHTTCDRWDIGGVSSALHPDTGKPTVLVYDGHAGGAGFSERGYAQLAPWLASTLGAVSACTCPAGCPSCVQSPKCGNGNDPLSKPGALLVLESVMRELDYQS
jgi:DEAD/DEAH box helicase domain-containing protein